jgi:hypothetical protein
MNRIGLFLLVVCLLGSLTMCKNLEVIGESFAFGTVQDGNGVNVRLYSSNALNSILTETLTNEKGEFRFNYKFDSFIPLKDGFTPNINAISSKDTINGYFLLVQAGSLNNLRFYQSGVMYSNGGKKKNVAALEFGNIKLSSTPTKLSIQVLKNDVPQSSKNVSLYLSEEDMNSNKVAVSLFDNITPLTVKTNNKGEAIFANDLNAGNTLYSLEPNRTYWFKVEGAASQDVNSKRININGVFRDFRDTTKVKVKIQ